MYRIIIGFIGVIIVLRIFSSIDTLSAMLLMALIFTGLGFRFLSYLSWEWALSGAVIGGLISVFIKYVLEEE
jgi:hypothetical protein